MSNTTRVLGIEEADHDACECCGAICTKKRVVLDFDGDIRRYGVTCASLAVLPNSQHHSKQRQEQILVRKAKETAKANTIHQAMQAKAEMHAERQEISNDTAMIWVWRTTCPVAKIA